MHLLQNPMLCMQNLLLLLMLLNLLEIPMCLIIVKNILVLFWGKDGHIVGFCFRLAHKQKKEREIAFAKSKWQKSGFLSRKPVRPQWVPRSDRLLSVGQTGHRSDWRYRSGQTGHCTSVRPASDEFF